MGKDCEGCGRRFVKRRESLRQWQQRRFCSLDCAYAARKGTRRGPEHPSWKGGRHIHPDGYVMVRREGRYALEHRVVMEAAVGRPLRDDETVHHLNGDRADNRLENLELRSGRHGKGAAMCCAECGSTNLVPWTYTLTVS
jgi:hypothetical protein